MSVRPLQRRRTNWSRVGLALVVLLPLFLPSACEWGTVPSGQIWVPLRPCVIKGAPLTDTGGGSFSDVGTDAADNFVRSVVSEANNKIWIPGANIRFFPSLYAGTGAGAGFSVPVIPDPEPPSPQHYIDYANYGPGELGDIFVGEPGFQLVTNEMDQAYATCLATWHLGANSGKPGTIVIIARDLVGDQFGNPSGSVGVNPGHSATWLRNGGVDLCTVPRHLLVSDVASQYAILPDPSLYAGHGTGFFYNTLAHELGHTLLESHGDGLNNGGTLPPNVGPRKFNADCGGTQTGISLMSASGGNDAVTPLEAELARDAAKLVPGRSLF